MPRDTAEFVVDKFMEILTDFGLVNQLDLQGVGRIWTIGRVKKGMKPAISYTDAIGEMKSILERAPD